MLAVRRRPVQTLLHSGPNLIFTIIIIIVVVVVVVVIVIVLVMSGLFGKFVIHQRLVFVFVVVVVVFVVVVVTLVVVVIVVVVFLRIALLDGNGWKAQR